jgi:hypothetical protein
MFVPLPFGFWRVTETTGKGHFHCPHCRSQENYLKKRKRTVFAVCFIPVISIGDVQRLWECRRCNQVFEKKDLFEQRENDEDEGSGKRPLPPKTLERLGNGTSLQSIQQELVSSGMDSNVAWENLVELCKKRPITCTCGLTYHPSVGRCRKCGGRL